ncbi:MAG: metallophosphoesterase [Saprospiraceae bacterium]|nr:metallophosphoesterase [Saprospiraceae bacterium]
MRIALMTDPHTGSETDRPFDIDLRKNFKDVLEKIVAVNPDLLVIGGDLCLQDGDVNIYRWQRDLLNDTNLHYYIIAGNHDSPTHLSKVFDKLPPLQHGELYYSEQNHESLMLFLDTSKGSMSGRQKDWLEAQLNKTENHTIIFMHHPPELMNVPHMDERHFLRDKDEVMQILQTSHAPLHIFCGHYHVEKVVHLGNIHVHITPSCYFQIDANERDFYVDHTDIAYRVINLTPDRLETCVHYLPGNIYQP